jgi:hypothetical protein
VSIFLYRRGKGVKRRVAHLAMYDRHGNVAGPWCGNQVVLDTSCNLPLGLRVCKKCRKAEGATP